VSNIGIDKNSLSAGELLDALEQERNISPIRRIMNLNRNLSTYARPLHTQPFLFGVEDLHAGVGPSPTDE
jgi:hypothetical protein